MALTRPTPDKHAAAPVSPDNLPSQNANAAMWHSVRAGAVGGAYALGGTVLFSLLAQRCSPVYRSIGLSGKLILVTAATVGASVFAAERSIYYFNRPFLAEPVAPATGAKAFDWAAFALEHRFEIVGGLSGSGVLGAILYVARDRNKTPSEKFMSIRLFSQAAALMTLLGAVGAAALMAQKKHLEQDREKSSSPQRNKE